MRPRSSRYIPLSEAGSRSVFEHCVAVGVEGHGHAAMLH